MSSRRLFLKIFLWYWLATTATVGVLAILAWIDPFTMQPEFGSLEELHTLQASGALAVRDAQGQEAFERHAATLERVSGLRTWWIDERGQDLRGQELPQSILAIAQRSDATSATAPRSRSGPRGPMVLPLTDRAGHRVVAVAQPLRRDRQPYVQALVLSREFIVRSIVAVLAAGLGCYALAHYLTSPLRRLQHAADRIASGELSARVGRTLTDRRDEIGDLGRDFDRMATQVESLVDSHERLLRDVSHELRSPLARLGVALELAAQDASPAVASSLARVRREADRLNSLIADLLTLARLKAAEAEPPVTRFDLAALLADVVDDAQFEATTSERAVRLVDCESVEVAGSPELLRSAIDNIVRNALRYTAPRTSVEVALRVVAAADADEAANAVVSRIEIRDHGPGMPEDALQRMFQPFWRLDAARDRAGGGAGLGLAIADRAVRLHHGSIHARNSQGGGLVVCVTLPIAPDEVWPERS